MKSHYRFREHKTAAKAVVVGVQDRLWPDGSITGSTTFTRQVSSLNNTFVERCHDYTNVGPPYRSGSMLMLWRAHDPYYQVSGAGFNTAPYSAGTEYRYRGGLVPTDFGSLPPVTPANMQSVGVSGTYSGSYGESESFGIAAYNSARPKVQQFDAGVAIGEFRDFPRLLRHASSKYHDLYKAMGGRKQSAEMLPKKVADDFLASQFGWGPFISDYFGYMEVGSKTDQYVSRIRRDNDQWIKRGREVHKTDSHSNLQNIKSPGVYPSLNGILLESRNVEGTMTSGTSRIWHETSSHVWFEASFKYHLPQFDPSRPFHNTWLARMMRYSSLYGLRISPSTVYNLTPWSWLADWCTSIGDSIEILSSMGFDRLASKYAFVMRHTVKKVVKTSTLFMRDKNDKHGMWERFIETKSRTRATPFGFGLSEDSFSPRQLTILGALGISRM